MSSGGSTTEAEVSSLAQRLQPYVLPGLAVSVVVLAVAGQPVPYNNEFVHLPRLSTVADPTFLANDWTYSGGFTEYFTFDLLIGQTPRFLPVWVVAGIGRVAVWSALLIGLFLIARQLGLRPWPSAVAIGGWLVLGQSMVGGAWMFGTFEAKGIAYVFLVFALLNALRGRPRPATVLLGATFAFQPSVGLLGGLAIGGSMLLVSSYRRETLRSLWIAALIALPQSVAMISGLKDVPTAADDWRFYALDRAPWHLDFTSFEVAAFLAVVVMTAFNISVVYRMEPGKARHFLLAFQILLTVPPALGVLAHLTGTWAFFATHPYRLWPLFTPLLALLFAARMLPSRERPESASSDRNTPTAAVLGLVVILLVFSTNPLGDFALVARRTMGGWISGYEARDDALLWVRDNVPPQETGLLPPGWAEGHYLSEHPRVVSWKAPTFNDLTGFRSRLEAVTGGLEPLTDRQLIDDSFFALTPDEVLIIADDYGVTFVVTETQYPFDRLYANEEINIYTVP